MLTFRSLLRINLLVTLVIMVVTTIFLLIANQEPSKILGIVSMGAILVLVIGLADIYILGFSTSAGWNREASKKKRVLRHILTYIFSSVFYLVLWSIYAPIMHEDSFMWFHASFFTMIILSSWSINTLFIIIYNYSLVHHIKVQSEIENLQLKAIISETANQVLKQQIHPHFLFNVLNTVKSLYKQDIKQGETYLVHLANFLRASISNPTAKIVKLEDELQLCRDYIEMQRIRFGNALTYRIDLPDVILHQKFVPYFSIQTLLENAIKHNQLTEEAPLNIAIVNEDEYISVINNLQPNQFKEPSTGQGLFNLAERYRLLTGDEIHISQSKNYFAVRIKLLNDDDSNHRR